MLGAVAPDAIQFEERPDRSAVEFLYERVREHNLAAADLPEARDLLALVRSEHGAVDGGIHGWCWGGTAEVDLLWVHESMRGRGMGGSLLAAFEAEARRHGCTQVVLETFAFGPVAFYARRGYTEVGRTEGYPTGHAHLVLRKRLTTTD
ncbi:MAG: GNAT family N-acetyltransferase [Actinomycetes bacterium]